LDFEFEDAPPIDEPDDASINELPEERRRYRQFMEWV
jgi:hypothetical protein